MKSFPKTIFFFILLIQSLNASVLVRYVSEDDELIQPSAGGDIFTKLRSSADKFFKNLNTPFATQKQFSRGGERGPQASNALALIEQLSIEQKTQINFNSDSNEWKRVHPFLRQIY